MGTRASRFPQAPTLGDSTPGQDRVGPSRHRPIAHGWKPRTPRKTKQDPAGSLREARGTKEGPEALSNRNGEGAIAISPSRTRSKRHLAPHFLTESLSAPAMEEFWPSEIPEVPSGFMIERLDFTYEYKYMRNDPDEEKQGPS